MYNFNPIGYQVAYTNFALNQLQVSPMTPPLTPPNSEGSEANSSPNTSNASDPDIQLMKTSDSSKIKRTRTAFTNEQLMELEREFQKCVYLDRTGRIGIAERLGIMDKQVKVWFQNRRMKSKKSIIPNGNRVMKPHQGHQGIVKRLMSFTQDSVNSENLKPTPAVTTPQATVMATQTVQHQGLAQKKIDAVTPKSLPVHKPMAAQLLTGPVRFQQQTKPFKPQLMIQLPVTSRPALQNIPTQNSFIIPKIESVSQEMPVRQLRTDMPTTSKHIQLQTNSIIPLENLMPTSKWKQHVVYKPVSMTYPNQQGQFNQSQNFSRILPISGPNQLPTQEKQVQHTQQYQHVIQQKVQNEVASHQIQHQQSPLQPERQVLPQQQKQVQHIQRYQQEIQHHLNASHQHQESPRQPEERPRGSQQENPKTVPMPQAQEQHPTPSDTDSNNSKAVEDPEMDLYESLILSLDIGKESENTYCNVDLAAILDNLTSVEPTSQVQNPVTSETSRQPEQAPQQLRVSTSQQSEIETEPSQQVPVSTNQQFNVGAELPQQVPVSTNQQFKIETEVYESQIKMEQSPHQDQQFMQQHDATMSMDLMDHMEIEDFVANVKPEDYDFDLDDFVENLDKYMSYPSSSQDPMLGHTSLQDYSFSFNAFNSSATLEQYASTSQRSVDTLTPPGASFNFEPAVPMVNISFDDCMDPQSMKKEPIITYNF